jgi:hypothetical protein
MEDYSDLFGCTSLLILYELEKPDNLQVFNITGFKEVSKEELVGMNYPKPQPRKKYMMFSIADAGMDLSMSVRHQLIEKLTEMNAKKEKGKPIFIKP